MTVSTLLTVTYDGEPYLIVTAHTPAAALDLAARHMGLTRDGAAALAPEQRLKLDTRIPTPAEIERWEISAARVRRNGGTPPGALPLSLLEDDDA
jgi:hypothetical protein